jgi:hypothetical protein
MQKPTGSLRAVLVHPHCRSDALDPEMDFAKYIETRDESLVKVRTGMVAPWFVLKPIKKVLCAEHLDTIQTHTARAHASFLVACHEIDCGNDRILKPEPGELTPGAYGSHVASDEWMDRVANEFGLEAVYEMGHLAWQRARLKAGAAGPFTLWAGTGVGR